MFLIAALEKLVKPVKPGLDVQAAKRLRLTVLSTFVFAKYSDESTFECQAAYQPNTHSATRWFLWANPNFDLSLAIQNVCRTTEIQGTSKRSPGGQNRAPRSTEAPPSSPDLKVSKSQPERERHSAGSMNEVRFFVCSCFVFELCCCSVNNASLRAQHLRQLSNRMAPSWCHRVRERSYTVQILDRRCTIATMLENMANRMFAS